MDFLLLSESFWGLAGAVLCGSFNSDSGSLLLALSGDLLLSVGALVSLRIPLVAIQTSVRLCSQQAQHQEGLQSFFWYR